jgi:hypothetical protein
MSRACMGVPPSVEGRGGVGVPTEGGRVDVGVGRAFLRGSGERHICLVRGDRVCVCVYRGYSVCVYIYRGYRECVCV